MLIIEKLKKLCKENPQRIIFAEAGDERIISAANWLLKEGFAEPILCGGIFELRDMADKLGISSKNFQIINTEHEKEFRPYVAQLSKKVENQISSAYAIESLVKNAVIQSILRIKFGHADIVLSGNKSNMAKTARAAIRFSGVNKNLMKASSFYMLVSPDQKNTYFFADCSINVTPSARDMAETAILTAQHYSLITGREPRVALLSFSTKGSAKHQSIDTINEALKLIHKQNSNLICDGEIQFDTAVNSLVAEKKAPDSSLNGKANVFIFPSLNSGNIAQKIAEHIGAFFSIGPMFQGLNHDVHHLPKSYSVDGIINSALLASYLKISKLKN